MTDIRHSVAIYPDLRKRSVFISGGATGIGRSLVEAFARQGARTGFVDIAAEAGQALADTLRGEGCDVLFRSCDITDTRGYQDIIRSVASAHGPITALINNAANDQRHSLDTLTPEDFDALVAVNLKHFTFAIQTVLPMMRATNGGSIVNVGSICWMIADRGFPVYTANKAAVHGLTRGLGRELGADRIRINTLAPGWVMTDKQKQLWLDDAGREKIRLNQMLPGDLLPQHIAQMALFLASDASAMCTAQSFVVDGGWV